MPAHKNKPASCILLLIRHAQTAMSGRFCGQIDPPLNQAGLAQLPQMVESLNHLQIDALYASDLRRTEQTAKAIGTAHGLRAERCSALREISFGAWEGQSWDEIAAADSDEAQQWVDAYPHRAAKGGEDFHSFCLRISTALNEIACRHSGQMVAVVTHGGVIRAALMRARGIPAQQLGAIPCGFASVHRLQISAEQWTAD